MCLKPSKLEPLVAKHHTMLEILKLHLAINLKETIDTVVTLRANLKTLLKSFHLLLQIRKSIGYQRYFNSLIPAWSNHHSGSWTWKKAPRLSRQFKEYNDSSQLRTKLEKTSWIMETDECSKTIIGKQNWRSKWHFSWYIRHWILFLR